MSLLEERLATLTPRESEAYALMNRSLSTMKIAQEMGIKWDHARTLKKKVRRKLGALSP